MAVGKVEPQKPAGERRRIKVQALYMGWYELKRRREGDVFLAWSTDLPAKWLVEVPMSTPERITTGNEELRREHTDLIRARAHTVEASV